MRKTFYYIGINVTIIGSSNAKGIKLTNSTTWRIHNKSKGGATMKSIVQQYKPPNRNEERSSKSSTNKDCTIIVIFQGPNGHPNDDWNKLRQEFNESMRSMIQKGLQPRNTIVLGPLPRGPNTSVWETQMETSAKILTDMHKLGLQTINIYNHIPHSMRTPHKIFGKKDLRLNHYVHYGDKVLQIINSLTEKKIFEIVTAQGKGNDNTTSVDKPSHI
jgi:hypothetical protein